MTDSGVDPRPDPDALLAHVREEESRQARGKLKVFFGAAAGVGKTYAMLEAARAQHAAGVDVVVGWIETHGRAETEALLPGLERLPPRAVEYRGTMLREFDLDAALARRPALILVDELAHTNAPGSRHAKRWQDVTELLAAGIDVYTTLNVQHLESLNDVVARVTEVPTRETVPDSILEEAAEVELVDLSPDDLIRRLRDGKVYVPEQAGEAMRRFFRKGNLIALRELALRTTAERVDAQMERYRREHAVPGVWPVAERILVCVSPSPFAARVVRAARRMAVGLRAQWVVVYVETAAAARLAPADRDRVVQTLRLAEQLGAETVTLTGHDVATEVLAYARRRNVTRIVLGKPARPRWRESLFGSVVNELIRQSGDIDVYVITGEREGTQSAAADRPAPPVDWTGYLQAAGVVAVCTVVAAAMFRHFAPANLIMVYLLGTILAAWRLGRGPSIFASLLSVAAFDFFFVTPYLTFAVSDTQYLVTFAVMLAVAVVISTLTTRVRAQADAARHRERRTAALYAMTRDLISQQELDELLRVATRHIAEVFGSRVAVFLPDAAGQLARRVGELGSGASDASELGVARWVYEHGQLAGRGSATLPGARALYLPLSAARGTVGVLAIEPPTAEAPATPRAAPSPRDLRRSGRPRHRARGARRGGPAGPPPVRGGPAPQLAPQRGLARSPDAAGHHHRLRQRPGGAGSRARPRGPARARARDPGGGRPPESPRAQPPGDDPARVRRHPRAQGLGARWRRSSGAPSRAWRSGSARDASTSGSPPICRSYRSIPSSSSRC